MTTSLLVEGRGEVDALRASTSPLPGPPPIDTVIPNGVRELIKSNENFISQFKFRGMRKEPKICNLFYFQYNFGFRKRE
jgi:hypothetical protein